MSAERLGPLDAARAALAAHEGGDAVAVVTLVGSGPAAGEDPVPEKPTPGGARGAGGGAGGGADLRPDARGAGGSAGGGSDLRPGARPGGGAAAAPELHPGARLLVPERGPRAGTLGHPALDAAAAELADAALTGAPPGTATVEAGALRASLYVEALFPPDALVVVGAGHIAVPLAALGASLGFRVTVLDDREGFATIERFPTAAAVLRADFADPFRDVRIGPRTSIVLVTRGHEHDFDCLRRLVMADDAPRYIGMIGSRRRVRAAFTALLRAGIPRARLARVRAPVGLDIGAETPEEIAVSIAAELVLARRRPSPDLDPATRAARERVLERLLPEATP